MKTTILGETKYPDPNDPDSKNIFHTNIVSKLTKNHKVRGEVRKYINDDPKASLVKQKVIEKENKVSKGPFSEIVDFVIPYINTGVNSAKNLYLKLVNTIISIGKPTTVPVNTSKLIETNVSWQILNESQSNLSGGDFVFNDPNLGGVDFSKLQIEGFSIDSISSQPIFISKAEETIQDDSIDLDSLANNFKRYFLEALIMSPENLFVSLDVINNEGRCRLAVPMEDTYMVRVMFDHDILMKSDYLTKALFGLGQTDPVDKGITAQWIEIFEASPFFQEYLNMGFGSTPYLQARAIIVGDSIKVNTIGNKIYLKEAPLTLDYSLEDLGMDQSGFNFTSAQLADIDRMLNQYQSIIEHRMDTAAIRFIEEINDSERYSELRRVFRAVACAKIYKDLDIDAGPYQGLINTNLLPGVLIHPDVFPREFYNQQAYQKLHEEAVTVTGQVLYLEVWGGVELQGLNVLDSVGLNQVQQEIFTTLDTGFLQDGNEYFLNQGEAGAPVSELYPSLLTVTPTDTSSRGFVEGQEVSIKVSIFNTSFIKAGPFTVAIYNEFFDNDGRLQQYLVDEIDLDSLAAYSSEEIQTTWQLLTTGSHGFRVSVDNDNLIAEIDEGNNSIKDFVFIDSNKPLALLLSPKEEENLPNQRAQFYYLALDGKERIPSSVTLVSDRDGQLTNQADSLNFVVSNLSLGQHTITLRCENDRGNIDEDQVTINVVPFDVPAVEIQNPIENQTLFTLVPYQLQSSTFDFTDSTLCDSPSANWYVNGSLIGNGCSSNYTFDNPGNYEIVFSASNSLGNESRDTISVFALDVSSNVNEIGVFPSTDTSYLLCCTEALDCDSTINLNLPYNAGIIEAPLQIRGVPTLLEPEIYSTGNDYSLGTIQNNYTGPAVNNDRGSYKFNRITAALGIDWADPNFQYPPINEKRSFKNGESVVLITYLNDVFVDVELMWVIEYPDLPDYEGGVDTVYGGIGVPQGIYYPVFPYDLPSSKDYWSGIERGDVKVDVYTRLYGTTDPFQFEQSITFTRDFAASEAPFNGSDPLKASHTLSADIQSSSPKLTD